MRGIRSSQKRTNFFAGAELPRREGLSKQEIRVKLERINRVLPAFQEQLFSCRLCPRECGANRFSGETGFCRAGKDVILYKYKLHHGEEPPISGSRGSGILFFAGCTMSCHFCQNFPMSHQFCGYRVSSLRLADIMLHLQEQGAHNINLVTATHYLPQVLQALQIAYGKGLRLPLVYNTSGYERTEILRLLEGIVDVYLPDMKYARDDSARRYSKCPGYVKANREAVKEMWRQVGPLRTDENGIARQGLIIRHLILPNHLPETLEILQYIRQTLGVGPAISLMSQYLPIWEAHRFPELQRRLTPEELQTAVTALHILGFSEGWIQEFCCEDCAGASASVHHLKPPPGSSNIKSRAATKSTCTVTPGSSPPIQAQNV